MLFLFFFSCFAVQPEYCSNRKVSIKDLSLLSNPKPFRIPDPVVSLSMNNVEFVQVNGTGISLSWAGPWSIDGVGETMKLKVKYWDQKISVTPGTREWTNISMYITTDTTKWTEIVSNYIDVFRFTISVVCTLTPCASRSPNTTGCYSSLDHEVAACYQKLDPLGNGTRLNECSTSCPSSLSDGASGQCRLKPCASRTANTSHTKYPCGTGDCFYDAPAPAVAGQQCVASAEECTATEHYAGTGANGVCVLKNCSARTRLDTAYPCGSSDCYYNEHASPSYCAESCAIPNHYLSQDGLCQLKSCRARLVDTLYMCGSDCFYDAAAPAAPGLQCVSACPSAADSHHTGETSTSGVCVLKDCSSRMFNATAAFPCGTAECIYDAQSTDGHPCGTTCSQAEQYRPSQESSSCVQKKCAELEGRRPCVARVEDCHFVEGKEECEDVGKYRKRRTLIVVAASVGGGIVLIVLVAVTVVVGRKCKKHVEKQKMIEEEGKLEKEESERVKKREVLKEKEKEMSDVHSFYVFKQSLGAGCFSEVFLAEHIKTKKEYAVKIIKFNPKGNEAQGHSGMISVEAEINVGVQLGKSCPYLVNYEDVNVQALAGTCFIAMEYCAGGDLRAHINRHLATECAFDEAELRRFGVQVGTAIAALHGADMIHRDIKPENVFLTADGTFKLGDYGTARLLTRKQTMTMAGTHGYIPPEILQDQGEYSTKVDIYSFGCVLLEMIALHHPFKNERDGLDFVAVSSGKRNPIDRSRSRCSASLLDLAEQMVSVDASCRPSINEVLKALQE